MRPWHSRLGAARVIGAVALVVATGAAAETDYGTRLGRHSSGELSYVPEGPGTLMEAVEPLLQKRYLPQELEREYGWRSWSSTNYATEPYKVYVDPNSWGDHFYDLYGNYLTRGWLVYNWTEEHPRISEGSRLLKRGEYSGFFRSLVIASDVKDQYAFSITVGDELLSTLTPMTFRKAVFNGAQVDFMSDRIAVTGILSRISAPGFITDPNPASFNDYTNLIGGRATARIGDVTTLGATFVNAHSGRGTLESFKGNPFKGELTSAQLEDQITTIVIRLSDDSPADNRGGAVLLADDVEITTRIGERDTVLTGNSIGFTPERIGGTIREGLPTANGTEQILLRYHLPRLAEIVDDRDLVNNISAVRFRLVLVNDYRVEITSDRQTSAENQPVFLIVAQAEGNVQDGTNKRQVAFNYGLPTANQIYGFTVEVKDFLGFDLYSELDLNHRYRKYPNRRSETHQAFSGTEGDEVAGAWMMNLGKSRPPWSFFAEAFYTDEDYTTSPYIVGGDGRIDYGDPTRGIYDFVDDNDDQDRKPDQKRLYQDPRTGQERGAQGRSTEGFADEAVFPGGDENNDFISDFNQNSNFFRENRFPDYEEPFLRYNTDRPEFLFGIDLNNNGWIDRFENDNRADLPYRPDQRGYNVYVKNQPNPELKLTAGRTHARLISDQRKNDTWYGLVAYEQDFAVLGRVRVFDMLKKAEDDIQDDLVQWVQLPGLPGSHQNIDDPLFARDTWINTLWLGVDRQVNWGINFAHKFKLETLRQGDKAKAMGSAKDTRFLGIINKADYLHRFGIFRVRPKLKSEYLRDNTPMSMGGVRGQRDHWAGTALLVCDFPVLNRTEIEAGVEQTFHADLGADEAELPRGEFTGDLRNTVVAVQLSNRGEYLGYRLTTQLGFTLSQVSRERVAAARQSQTNSSVFMTIYASLKD
ncbi:MAG: hypothetical protein IT369_09945 [Candidatus Latescibacteria bacterium]|nr:hypothetical protein [Candidatus Latescibacterota bacterium]